jgi:tetratricopeptide (TPR) repeat protein
MRSPRLLFVQGMSGSGKTSLINAGLRPLLELRPVEKIASWSVVSIRPSESLAELSDQGAFGALASRLLATLQPGNHSGMSAAKLADLLRTRPEVAVAHLDEWIAAAAPRDGVTRLAARLVVFIDQLEEAFAPSVSPNASTALFGMIVAVSASESVWVVATVRSDFTYRLESIPALVKCLEGNPPYTLLPPGPGELVDIIREPARMARLLWEEKDGVTLDKALLRDAVGNPEALPLLEYTLAELYESRDGRYLRWSAYKGDLSKAVVAAADAVVDSIGDAGAFGTVMRELVSVLGDGTETRRYARISNLPPDSNARVLLTGLIDRRLCTADQKAGEGPVAYLSHEALIRAWPRAQAWLAKEKSMLRLRDELARDVASWESHDRSPGYLATAPEKRAVLREVERAGLLVGNSEEEFARKSRGRARRNQLLKQAAVTGICALTVLALYEWRDALIKGEAARRAADTARRSTQFMVSLFQQADPDSGQGETVTAAAVLRKGADEINGAGGRNLRTESAVRAELLTAMGQSYTGLGLYSDAQRLLDEATQDESKVVVPNDLKLRTKLAAGTLLSQRSKYQAAQQPLREAVMLAQSLPASDILRSQALVGLGDDLSELGNSEADKYLQEALTADRARVASHPGSEEALGMLARTLDSMGDNLFGDKKLKDAEAYLREAVNLRAKVYGPFGALTGQSMNNLGAVLYESGQYQASLREYRDVLPIYSKVYGSEHREIATLLSNIGGSELMLGQVSDAQRDLEKALKMTEKLEGESHEDLVPPLNRLAMIDEYENRLSEAEQKIDKAAGIVGVDEHSTLRNQILLTQGYLAMLKGNRKLAGQLLTDSKNALERHRDRSEEYAWQKALWDAIDAQLVASNGDVPKARGMLSEARQELLKRFGGRSFYMLLVARVTQAIDAMPRGK